MSNLKEKKLFLLDMDGTIYLDNELYDGTLDFLDHVKKIGGKYMFLTNNSSKSVDKYIEKLAGLGISAVKDDFLTSTDATILYLNDKSYKKIYALGTTPDWVCPTWYGYVPDCGSVSEMLYNATKRRPKFIGKPQPDMALLAIKASGYSPEETVLIGDRLYTDIACGVNAGISTIFVLSGEGTMADLEASDKKPEFVFDNIRKIYEEISE